jgi:isopentenyl diphosphate isomerase/L-lactate dehydrogenase-like FMN-dependent dehydrogenase
MPALNTVEQYRLVAKRRLPQIVFDYIDGGAGTRSAVLGNRRAFEEVTLRPHGGTDPSGLDLSVTVLGHSLSMPLMIAPTGMSSLAHTSGDIAGVRAAKRAGTIFMQSAMSGHAVQDVVAAADGAPVWFQLYRIGTQAQAETMVERVRDAGVEALVVTMDSTMPLPGQVRRVPRMRGGPSALLGRSRTRAAPAFVRLMRHPRWLSDHVRAGIRPRLMNVIQANGEAQYVGRGPGPSGLGWKDLDWIRDRFDGPIFVKGIIVPEDAIRAAEEGAAGIMVSNHGGRQLDTVDATLRALPEMVDAVNGRCDVFVDGGVRTGIDVLKAVSLGAKAVMIGRPWLWGLAVNGERGVDDVLGIFRAEMLGTLSRLGSGKVTELNRTYVRTPADWLGPPRVKLG